MRSVKLSQLALIVGITVGVMALWAGSAPVLGARSSVIGGWSFKTIDTGVWIGCDSGSCSMCAGTLGRECEDGPDCYGGSITVASPSYRPNDPEPYAAGVAGCSGGLQCQWVRHAGCPD